MEPFDLREWEGFKEAGGDGSKPAIIDQIVIDSRRIDSNYTLFVALKGKEQDGHKFIIQAANSGAQYALVEKNWTPPELSKPIILLRVLDPLSAFQSIAKLYRQKLKATVIGVTGSYGKTMLKDLLHEIVSSKKSFASPESFNSQIGVPLSLLMMKNADEIAIIEAGISMQGEMDILANMIVPDGVILTNVGKAHLKSLKNLETTAQEKVKLITRVPLLKWALVPNHSLLPPLLNNISALIFDWGKISPELPYAYPIKAQADAKMPYQVFFPDGNIYNGLMTTGFHYFLDLVNMAVKAAWLLNLSSHKICEGLEKYQPESMCSETWKSPFGATFINDSYCSDPQSIDIALKSFEQASANQRKVFVFGGMRKYKDSLATEYKRIGKSIAKAHLDILMLFDNQEFGPLIEEVNAHSAHTEISICHNYQEAIKQMRLKLRYDDFVLIKGSKKESLDKLTESFDDSISNNQCLINLTSVQHNIEILQNKLTSNIRLMIMIKALAYGTDDIRMAKFLKTCGIEILGVSYVDEGVSLRRSGVTQEIFVINAAIYECVKVIRWNLQVGISDYEMVGVLAKEAEVQNKVIKVHLHVDTGMSRFGCRPEEALKLAQHIKSKPSLFLEGIMTHFACADNPTQDEFTLMQARRFDEVIENLKKSGITIPWHHAANSSGAIRFDFPQFNMVRIGLAAYGLHCSEAAKNAIDLKLALTLVSKIVGINVCKAGETISYGRRYQVKKDEQRIAVIPIGYFDGLHRNYSGKGSVIIRGHKAPMVGNICMDFMMIDVSDIPNVQAGDPVLVFGTDEHGHYLSPEELASSGESIVHELVTCLGPRIQRVFIN